MGEEFHRSRPELVDPDRLRRQPGGIVDDQPPLGDRQRLLHAEISAAVTEIIDHIPQRDQT